MPTPTSAKATPVQPSDSTKVATVVPSDRHENCCGSNWFDFGAAWAWPLTLLILFVIFRKGVSNLLGDIQEGNFFGLRFKRRDGEAPASLGAGAFFRVIELEQLPIERLSSEGVELLSTLWHHHLSHVGEDFSTKRWSFTLAPTSRRYVAYLRAVFETVQLGLVAVNPQNLQCFLTDAGVEFCRRNKDKMRGDFWGS
jgi:hypothetical protein